eukprot:COSAG02_NODE_5708_length_4104_cov_6.627216_3_plen_112_part_00
MSVRINLRGSGAVARDYINGTYDIDVRKGKIDGVVCYKQVECSKDGKDADSVYTITRRDGYWWIDYKNGPAEYFRVKSNNNLPPQSGWEPVMDRRTRAGVQDGAALEVFAG